MENRERQRIVGKEYALPGPGCQAGLSRALPTEGEPDSPALPFPWLGIPRRPRVGGASKRELAALLVALVAWGCAPPDHPARLPDSPPAGVEAVVRAEEVRALSAGPGTAYYSLKSEEGPWAIHLLRVDMNRCELGLEVVRAPRQEELAGGRSRVTELLAGPDPRIVAAVNGDFFTPEGLPLGTEVVGGDVRRVRDRPAFAWRPGAPPWMGVPTTEGDSVLVVGWRIPRGAPDGVSQVVGGFPQLLVEGGRVGDLLVGENPSFAAARHPRTAVGFDPSSGHLWLVGVDGRQSGYSDGMSLPELAGLLEALGVTQAVNLDGGGSTVMVLQGVAVSRPSDAEGERPVVNALAVVRDPGLCRSGVFSR